MDGMSTDGTRGLIEDCARSHPMIRLLDNHRHTTPAALNVGVAHASGEVILRMDAHSVYPLNYVSRLVSWLERSGADNVGGRWITLASGTTAIAQAIAIALSNPLGVGNAYYRIGSTEPRWVDTVPYGCYRREVFDRIGLFDEELVRNQDDEFNHRLIRSGGRILLVPDVTCHYYARSSLASLSKMLYQYGYLKPLAARKVGAILTLRQLIPGAFVLALLGSGALATWSNAMRVVGGTALGLYAVAIVGVALVVALQRGVRVGFALCLTFPSMHVSYGVGFLRGVLEFILLRRDPKRAVQRLTSSR